MTPMLQILGLLNVCGVPKVCILKKLNGLSICFKQNNTTFLQIAIIFNSIACIKSVTEDECLQCHLAVLWQVLS